MASNASDIEISSSLDQDEEPLGELTEEELHMLVEENTYEMKNLLHHQTDSVVTIFMIGQQLSCPTLRSR